MSEGLSDKDIVKGRVYRLTDDKIGELKFIGKTFAKPGVVLYGFELQKQFKGKITGVWRGLNTSSAQKGKVFSSERNELLNESHQKQESLSPRKRNKVQERQEKVNIKQRNLISKMTAVRFWTQRIIPRPSKERQRLPKKLVQEKQGRVITRLKNLISKMTAAF
eukprot:UN30075